MRAPRHPFALLVLLTLFFALTVSVAIAGAAGGAYVSTPFLPVQNSTSMLLGDDGATLYVLNPYTDDVSVFDVAK